MAPWPSQILLLKFSILSEATLTYNIAEKVMNTVNEVDMNTTTGRQTNELKCCKKEIMEELMARKKAQHSNKIRAVCYKNNFF